MADYSEATALLRVTKAGVRQTNEKVLTLPRGGAGIKVLGALDYLIRMCGYDVEKASS